VARQHDVDISRFEIVDASHSEDAAAKGVQLIHEAKGELSALTPLQTWFSWPASLYFWLCSSNGRQSYRVDLAHGQVLHAQVRIPQLIDGMWKSAIWPHA
jgi:hypothetical protein